MEQLALVWVCPKCLVSVRSRNDQSQHISCLSCQQFSCFSKICILLNYIQTTSVISTTLSCFLFPAILFYFRTRVSERFVHVHEESLETTLHVLDLNFETQCVVEWPDIVWSDDKVVWLVPNCCPQRKRGRMLATFESLASWFKSSQSFQSDGEIQRRKCGIDSLTVCSMVVSRQRFIFKPGALGQHCTLCHIVTQRMVCVCVCMSVTKHDQIKCHCRRAGIEFQCIIVFSFIPDHIQWVSIVGSRRAWRSRFLSLIAFPHHPCTLSWRAVHRQLTHDEMNGDYYIITAKIFIHVSKARTWLCQQWGGAWILEAYSNQVMKSTVLYTM